MGGSSFGHLAEDDDDIFSIIDDEHAEMIVGMVGGSFGEADDTDDAMELSRKEKESLHDVVVAGGEDHSDSQTNRANCAVQGKELAGDLLGRVRSGVSSGLDRMRDIGLPGAGDRLGDAGHRLREGVGYVTEGVTRAARWDGFLFGMMVVECDDS